MKIGRITDSKIGKNKDGDKNVRLLTVEISDPDDLQTVELINDAGEDNNPPIDSNVIILNLGDSWPVAIAVDDGVEPDALTALGERVLYASVGGSIVSYVKADVLGNIEVNGDADFAVAYNDLKTAFDQLKADFDAFVGTKAPPGAVYNLHTHPVTAAPGTTGPPNQLGDQSTADMSPAQVPTVKLP